MIAELKAVTQAKMDELRANGASLMEATVQADRLTLKEQKAIKDRYLGVETKPLTINNDNNNFSKIKDIKQEIAKISKLPFSERIPYLIKTGMISSKITYNLGKRFPIILNLEGEKVAFYRSSEGTGGKEKGSWTPMFGFGESKGNPWLIKGTIENINKSYDNPIIKQYQDLLNKTLNWSHSLDKGQIKNHPYFKELILSSSKEAFNKELYGIENLGIVNGESKISEYINSKLSKINFKYNIKLDNLENNSQNTRNSQKNSLPLHEVNNTKESEEVEILKEEVKDKSEITASKEVTQELMKKVISKKLIKVNSKAFKEIMNLSNQERFNSLKEIADANQLDISSIITKCK